MVFSLEHDIKVTKNHQNLLPTQSVLVAHTVYIYSYSCSSALRSVRSQHNVLSRAINFGRQCHFKIWLDCHNFKKFLFLIMPTSTKCQKIEKKMSINVIQHDDRL
jgi:hypothetical protein